MDKIRQLLEALEQELRNEKQYSAADKLLPIIEEAEKEKFTDYHGVVEQLEEYINESNNIDYNRALAEAIEVIEKRTYLKDGWILCSERFPKEEGMYLITSNLFGILEVQYVFYSENVQMFVCNGTPVAWRELPEPYKGE